MNYESYTNKTPLMLPCKGLWIAGSAGRSHEKNFHRSADGNGPNDQLYAIDFIKEHSGEGKDLHDYEAFGAEVIAPGDGLVTQIVNGNFDVSIGETDWMVVCGNMVIIDHENGEWSVLCHFKHDSITAKVGDRVQQGDFIGLCGNSGNTSEPHIHYHLQDNAVPFKAHGLPIHFTNIHVDGELKENIELDGGQKVSN